MKPQHLLLTVPFIITGDSVVDAFVCYKSNKRNVISEKEPNTLSRSFSRKTHISDYEVYSPILNHASPSLFLESSIMEPVAVPIDIAVSSHGMPWRTTIGDSEKNDPLLYMPFWEWQMEFMKESLTNLRSEDLTKTTFSLRENKEKRARIVSQCYSSDEYRKIRMTYYDAGDNTQVFNSVFYPRPEYNLPILGVDLLAFNRKKYLAIVDFQPIHEDESLHAANYEHRLKPIKETYKSLNGKMSARFYDETKFFSQQMLFSRFEDESIVSKELFPAFQRYVKLHTKILHETTPNSSLSSRSLVLERQKAYDNYSAERDPATGLFTAMFGQEWAENFVFNFLFSLSDKKKTSSTYRP